MIPIQSMEDLQDLNSADVRKVLEMTAKYPESKRRLIGQLLLLPKRGEVQNTEALDKAVKQLEKEMGVKSNRGAKPNPNSARSLIIAKIQTEGKVSREDLISLLVAKRGWQRSQAMNNLDSMASKYLVRQRIDNITYYSLKA